MDARDEFRGAVLSTIERCMELDYNPRRLRQMIDERHPVEVAKHLVQSGDFQYGIRDLTKLGRQDLTIESIMLRKPFACLFTSEELAAAKWRLQGVGSSRQK